MTLSYYRDKRWLIKNLIDTKHDEWMSHVSQDDYCFEIEAVMRANINKLYDMLEQADRDIRRVKTELLEAHNG